MSLDSVDHVNASMHNSYPKLASNDEEDIKVIPPPAPIAPISPYEQYNVSAGQGKKVPPLKGLKDIFPGEH